MRRVLRASGPLVLALVAASGAASHADWLLMKDGSRLETRGGWEVRGQQVVVTLTSGTLAAVRLDKVDLDGSARLTEAARASKAAPAPPTRKPAITVTDADLASAASRAVSPGATAARSAAGAAPTAASVAASAAAPPASAAAPAAAPTPASGSGLEVTGWSQSYDADSRTTIVKGTVRNGRETLAYNVSVVASVLDGNGKLLTRSNATLDAAGIAPGESATFTLQYPGAIDIGDATFDLTADHVATHAPPAAAAAPATTAAPPAAAEPQRRLQIGTWRPDPEAPAGSVALIGVLTNASSETAYDVTLDVALRGPDGKDLASAQALLGAATLEAGGSTGFRVSFPGVTGYTDVAFSSRHSVRRAG